MGVGPPQRRVKEGKKKRLANPVLIRNSAGAVRGCLSLIGRGSRAEGYRGRGGREIRAKKRLAAGWGVEVCPFIDGAKTGWGDRRANRGGGKGDAKGGPMLSGKPIVNRFFIRSCRVQRTGRLGGLRFSSTKKS